MTQEFIKAIDDNDIKFIKQFCYNYPKDVSKDFFQYLLYWKSYNTQTPILKNKLSLNVIFLNFCGNGNYTNDNNHNCYCNYFYNSRRYISKKVRLHQNSCKNKNFIDSKDYIYYTDECRESGYEPCELDYFLNGKDLLEMKPIVYYSLRNYIKTLKNVTNENSVELYRLYIIVKRLKKYLIDDLLKIVLIY